MPQADSTSVLHFERAKFGAFVWCLLDNAVQKPHVTAKTDHRLKILIASRANQGAKFDSDSKPVAIAETANNSKYY